MTRDESLSAFPRPKFWPTDGDPDHDGIAQGGMSLRDYFAAQALIGLIINPSSVTPTVPITRRAYELADAMLERRQS